MNYIVLKAVKNNQENIYIENKINKKIIFIGCGIGCIICCVTCGGIYYYLKFYEKNSILNETQQGLLYDVLSKTNVNDLSHGVRVLDAKIKDEKAVKEFILSIDGEKDSMKKYIKEFKKFTHPSWTIFNKLVDLNINKFDKNKICDLFLGQDILNKLKNKGVDINLLIENNISIIQNILGDNYSLFEELTKNNKVLSQFILIYLAV